MSNVTVSDKFEFVRKMNDYLKSLGYETGSLNGHKNEALLDSDGISVIFDEKGFFNRLFHIKRIHCRLSWIEGKPIEMRVPGRGENGEHLNKMSVLASQISTAFNRKVTVELTSENFEYETSSIMD